MQFIAVTTKDGHVFYVLINYTAQNGEDNVYFLNKVDDYDLYALLYAGEEDEDGKAKYTPEQAAKAAEKANGRVKNDDSSADDSDETETAEGETNEGDTETPVKKAPVNNSMMLIVGVLALAGFGVAGFFFMKKKKNSGKDAVENAIDDIDADPEPIQQTAQTKKPEKAKPEFAAGPIVDGVQVYEALVAEIDRGTGFVDGKLYVQEFYDEQHPTTQQLADHLKKAYGIGGHSGDGNISLVSTDGKGMTFDFENGEKFRHSWFNVATMTKARLEDNTYLSAEQQEKYAQRRAEKSAEAESTLNPVDSRLEAPC